MTPHAQPRSPTETSYLDGEDPESTVAAEARHWIAVYTELVTFKEQLLADYHLAIGDASQSATRQEIARTVIAYAELQLAWLRGRLDSWRRRHLELLAEVSPLRQST